MITVRNLQRKQPLALESLQSFAERACQLCQKKLPNESSKRIDVLLISDRRMAALHHQFLQVSGPTDVLTFQHGEIFISVETAAENARRFKTTMEKEVQLYLVHGLLHLCGYDDINPIAARRMEKAQRRIFASALRPV